MKTRNLLLCAATAASVAFLACNKNENNAATEQARLQVALTDDPANYEVVNIDVRDVLINYSSDTASGWTSLSGVRTGNYDVLRLANGKDTLLADAPISTGKIQQIRLVLGSNNFIRLNGQQYNLETPSAQQSGLKIKINQDVNEGVTYKLLLDFDASRSIVKAGNSGKYMLKPVIRASLEAIGGGVRGYVLPNSFSTFVYAIQGTDTITGTPTSSGAFLLRGLPAGNYTLAFVPSDASYQPQSRTGITVTTSNVTTVDTVRLIR